MATVLVIIHGLVAVSLLGAITHQTLATWAPSGAHRGSFFGRFRAVESAAFTNAIVVLYTVSAMLGATTYFYFKVEINPTLELDRHWQAIGFFDLKEDFVAIGLGILPASGALVLALVAALLPDRWTRWIWPGMLWATPVLAMIACVYLTIPWFRQ